ncbi:MAG: hypothetical protein JNL97_05345 [Verrucomicrobiales bacterium]|nr:hypothetical protein [Verrucomicrobiales bacterium]
MKTKSPREILLERHASTEPRLDVVRRSVLNTLRDRREPWWRVAWTEIVVAARPAWIGLGVLAAVAACLQGLAYRPTAFDSRTLGRWRVEPSVIREERRRLAEEVLEANVAPRTSPKPTREPFHENAPRRSQIPVRLWPVRDLLCATEPGLTGGTSNPSRTHSLVSRDRTIRAWRTTT